MNESYQDGIDSGNRILLLATALIIVFLASMIYVSALETRGGVYNEGFEYGTGSTTGDSGIDSNYGWYADRTITGWAASYDNTVSHTGNQSAKIYTTTGGGRWMNQYPSATDGYLTNRGIRVKPNTTYKLCFWAKTVDVNTDSVYGRLAVYDINGSSGGVNSYTSGLTGTNDWTKLCVSGTTNSVGNYAVISLYNLSGLDSNSWFDDVRLEEVDSINLGNSLDVRPSVTITGVTDLNAIDQYESGSDLNYFIGDYGGTDYNLSQSFTPTKNKFVSFDVNKGTTLGTPAGNLVFSLRTSNLTTYSSSILAQKTFTLSEWNALNNGRTTISLPAIIDANGTNLYWITITDTNTSENTNNAYVIYASSSGGYGGVGKLYRNDVDTGDDLYFRTTFAKLSSSVDLNVVNASGSSELKSYDVNGEILTDANITINPDGTGRYYKNDTSTMNYYLTDFQSVNRVGLVTAREKQIAIAPTKDINAVLKIQMPTNCEIDGNLIYKFTGTFTEGRYTVFSHSTDLINWIIDANYTASTNANTIINADGNKTIYIRLSYGGGDGDPNYFYKTYIDANLSCPSLTTPLFESGSNTLYTMNKSEAMENDYNTFDYNSSEYQSSATAYTKYATFTLPKNTLPPYTITNQIKETTTGENATKYKIYFTDGTSEDTSENTTVSSTYTTKTYAITTTTKAIDYIELWMSHTTTADRSWAKDTNITYTQTFNRNLYPSLMSNISFAYSTTTTTTMAYTIPDNNNEATITLTCTEATYGCKNTYYYIDSNTTFNEYTTPFTFTGLGHHTITYYSTNNNDNPSEITTSDLNMPILLTINKPKNTQTLATITEKWALATSGGVILNLTDLNTDLNIYIQPNQLTTLYISDMNGNYAANNYSRTYYDDSNDGTTDTLQPYLYSFNTTLATIITTLDAQTNLPIPNVTLKIYGNLPGFGYTLIGQATTDSKGQAIQQMFPGNTYVIETYYAGNLIKSFNINATGTSIYLVLNLTNTTPTNPNPSGLSANWTPSTNLTLATIGNQVFTQNLMNFGDKNISITSTLTQNSIDLTGSPQTYTGTSDKNFTYTIPWATITTGTITSKMVVTVDGKTYTFTKDYQITTGYGAGYNPLDGLVNGLRSDLSCSSDPLVPCYPLFIAAVLISIALALWATVQFGAMGGQSSGIIFLISMILFTFLAWIPIWVTAGLVLIILAFIVNERRN